MLRFTFLLASLTACSKAPQYNGMSYDNTTAKSVDVASSDEAVSSDAISSDMVQSSINEQQSHLNVSGQQRQFIKTAQIHFHVKNVYKTALTLEDMAVRYGGFVTHNHIVNEQRQTYRTKTDNGVQTILEEYQPIGDVTLRVPHATLQPFLREMVKHADFMYKRAFNAEDVLLDIIKQQKLAQVNHTASQQIQENKKENQTLSDTLYATEINTQYQRAKVLAELEKKHLQDKVAFSTITVALTQSPLVRTYTQNYFPYSIEQNQPSLMYQLEESVEAGWQNFLSFMISVVSLWPFTICLLILFFLFKMFKKWRQARKNKKIKQST